MKPKVFRTPAAFRAWLQRHHGTAAELLVGFYKRGAGTPSITWPEAVDEALCYGWIDGIRKRLDERRYTIRFTPRRPGSIWSAVNIRRALALAAEGAWPRRGTKPSRRADRTARGAIPTSNARVGWWRPMPGCSRAMQPPGSSSSPRSPRTAARRPGGCWARR